MREYFESIQVDGFAIIPHIVDSEMVSQLREELESVSSDEAVSRRGQSPYGIRNLLNVVPATRALAGHDALRALVDPILGKRAEVVRGIFFDKTPRANWKVAWHQDLTIAVREKRHVNGFRSWSIKAGIVHVQPPVAVLRNILTVRLHLDDTDQSNGALKVIAGSHRHGRMSAAEIQRWRGEGSAVTCAVPRGGVLVMRPLLLHASSASTDPARRRVVHLEYSSTELPGGLQWYGS
jgi:ectoine hydroxylase-related dioxygenase (phytanoyl-CoA dioxygenase family)